MTAKLVLGMDSGGSHTAAALADEHGQVVARAQAGSTKLLRVSREEAETRLDGLLTELFRLAAVTPNEVGRVCAGLSGYSVPWLRQAVADMLTERGLPGALLCGDEEIALAAARVRVTPGALVLVMAGTGSHAIGEHAGKRVHAGGWGPALGDEGGGTWLGTQAARQAVRQLDEQGSCPLLDRLMAAWNCRTPGEFVARAHQPDANPAELAPAVAQAGADGDLLANAILRDAGHELARLVQICVGRLGVTEPRVAWTGSILTRIQPVRTAMENQLGRWLCKAQVDPGATDPLDGALAMARED